MTRSFWKDLLERILWTFVQSFAGTFTAVPLMETLFPEGAINLTGLQTLGAAAFVSGISSVFTVLKGVAAARLSKQGTAQLIPGGSGTYEHLDDFYDDQEG